VRDLKELMCCKFVFVLILSWSGFGTHYVESEKLDGLVHELSTCDGNFKTVNSIIEAFSSVPTGPLKYSLQGEMRKVIDSCFKYDTVEEIMKALEQNNSEFASGCLKTLGKMSPTAMKVTLKQLRMGKRLSFRKCLEMENRMSYRTLEAVRSGKCVDNS
jgi:3-hydroxyisobutyryl-CoA hydrolase